MMARPWALACILVAVVAAGCAGPVTCHASDSALVRLKDDVPLDAIESAFVDGGWQVEGSRPPTLLFTFVKQAPSQDLTAMVSRQPSHSGNESWDYLLVAIVQSSRTTDGTEPEPTVEHEEATLLARLRTLGTEDRPPMPSPTAGAHTGWICPKV